MLQQPAGADAQALAVLEREIADRHREGERPRIEVVGVSGSWQNLAMARGLEATNGYNPLRIGSYDRLVSPGETTHIVDQRLFPASFDGYDCALARELGLEYVVLGRPIDEVPHLARRPVSDVLMAGPKIWIYRLRRKAESRVKFVKRVVGGGRRCAGEGRAVMRSIPSARRPSVDDDTALSHAMRRQAPARTRAARASFPGARTAWRSRSTTSSRASWWCTRPITPGWVAEVDGQPARILRTNVLFRGVEVGEGRHRVVFRFEPFSLSNLRDALMGLFPSLR